MKKKDLTERCRVLLNTYYYNTVATEDAEWLFTNIFSYHPEWSWYTDKGVIDHVEVRRPDSWGQTRCFFIVWTDGTAADISYVKCIRNRPIESL